MTYLPPTGSDSSTFIIFGYSESEGRNRLLQRCVFITYVKIGNCHVISE